MLTTLSKNSRRQQPTASSAMDAITGRVGAAKPGIDLGFGPVSKDWLLDERNGVNFLM
ncbi:MAG: hypothetical protein ACI9Z9_001423 [Litorivivens sp.]|jgi:hypothetical protein